MQEIKNSRLAYAFVLICGLLLLLTSLLHFLGISNTLIAIKTGDIGLSYAPTAVSVWLFAGTAMLLIGVWLLFLSSEIKKGLSKAWWQAIIIGWSLAAFSAGSWLTYPHELHLLYYLLVAMMLLIPLYLKRKQFVKSPPKAP